MAPSTKPQPAKKIDIQPTGLVYRGSPQQWGLNFTVDYESGENAMIQYFGDLFRGSSRTIRQPWPYLMQEWPNDATQAIFPFPQLEQTTDWMKCSHILVMSMTQKYSDPALMQIIQSGGTRSLEPVNYHHRMALDYAATGRPDPSSGFVFFYFFDSSVQGRHSKLGLSLGKSSSIATFIPWTRREELQCSEGAFTLEDEMDATAGQLAVRARRGW
jgi:hypothetical protein